MNLARVDQIAKAVLYEGYMLYPYRPSSVKNRQRWNFGVVYPETYSERSEGADVCITRTELLLNGDIDTRIEARLRFLHLQIRTKLSSSEANARSLPDGWQEAVERDVALPECALGELCQHTQRHEFEYPAETKTNSEGDALVARRQEAVQGAVDIFAERVRRELFKVTFFIQNTMPFENSCDDRDARDAALMNSLVSTHTVVGVKGGEFISLLEPPEGLQDVAASCRNAGWWPVLIGDPGERDTMLASPIILYDYPQIAPESAGDLFDGTEIDEILSLRILTLTDEEKNEIRQSDERARQILDRTESMPAEQFMKLHGAVRSLRPLKEDRP
ncbi:MAG: hypothetical protein ABSG34_00755 [Candidatus Sulfotelmatobacter sp.]|jgi:hydrogenase maturation protease